MSARTGVTAGRRAAVTLALCVSLAGCGLGGTSGVRRGAGRSQGLDIEQRHPNGSVVWVTGVSFAADRTTVVLEAVNGYSEKVELSSRGVWLRDDVGGKYPIAKPAQNADIQILPGQAIRARLVFMGPLDPRATKLRLLVNAYESEDSVNLNDRSRTSTNPAFQLDGIPVRR